MDENTVGVWFVSGDPHAEDGIYADMQNGKEPSCLSVVAVLVLCVLCIVLGAIFA